MRVRFDSFVFDPDSRELLRGGTAVHISPKAFTLLEALLASRPKALSKASIRDRLWSTTSVSDASLAILVNEIRSALGDNARHPRFVRTVQRFGYAFCGHALEAPQGDEHAGCFRLLWGDREVTLHDGENLLGRTPDAVIWIDSSAASRRHARIVVSGGSATLEDLGSKNGTFLGGKRIREPAPLKDGDEIKVGAALVTFRAFSAPIETRSDLQG